MAVSTTPDRAYVWIWLPGATDPVVAGVVRQNGDLLVYNYAASYLARPDAIPLYVPELPLQRGFLRPPDGLAVAGCIRDAAPDAWGQRVILARHAGRGTLTADTGDLPLLTYLLESGSDRVGAVDFQASPTAYIPRLTTASLATMQAATEDFLAGQPLPADLEDALLRGTSIGGARPKVLLRETSPGQLPRELIAKLSVASDPWPVVKAEAVAMDLARRVGLRVAATELIESLGRDVLLVERFDRPGTTGSLPGAVGQRTPVVSALTILGLDEMHGRYATYHGLADIIRARFTDPAATLRELFGRIVFNIAVSNTDDHARNHAAFWDGTMLSLTPAYDLSPQMRSGDSAQQAMEIARDGRRMSRMALCVEASEVFLLSREEARTIISEQVHVIESQWLDAADAARLTRADRELLWRTLILNPAVAYEL